MNDLTFDTILLTNAFQCDDKGKTLHSFKLSDAFLQTFLYIERHRHLQRIPQSALLYPKESLWRRVLGLMNDQALITLTGLDFITFEGILESFKFYYDNYTLLTKAGTIKMLDEAVPQC
jgi:hypothetical protein